MAIFALSALAAGVVSLVFGGLIILKDSRELNNRLYFLMSLSVSAWGVAYWFWLSTSVTVEQASFFISILTAASLLTALFFTHWVIVITRAHGLFWSIVLGATYGIILGFIAIIILQPELLIGSIHEKLIFPFWPTAGPLYVYHIAIAYMLPVSLALSRVIHRLIVTTKEVRRGQLLSIIAGTILGFGGGAINFFLWFDIPVPPYGNFAVILFPPLLGYSIIRYKLFTTRTIATELLVLFTVTGVFVQIFLASSLANLILQIIFFLAVALSSYLLLRSVYSGVRTREKLEILTNKLKHANARLKELDRQKSEFLSIATHQLRGPLAGIRGHLSLLADGSYGKIPKKASEVIDRIFSSSGLLVQTVNDFLNVSRIEQGSMQYDMKKFKCVKLVEEVVDELQPVAKNRKLKLTYENKCNGDCEVNADYGKLRHVIFNLTDNAIKYTEKGWVKILVECDAKKGVVRTEISDSGIGINKNEIGGLFEKFVRARGSSGININGTGLGLYVARQMIEAHDGKVWAESKGKGKGSTFIVEIPSAPTKSTKAKQK